MRLNSTMVGRGEARLLVAAAERIVVKLGTQVVTHNGVDFALGRIFGIVEEIGALHKEGKQVLLVSSGAVGMGMRELGIDAADSPLSLGMRQACAAVGQGRLMGLYAEAFGHLGIRCAQVLLSQDDIADRERALCLRTTLMRLLELGVVPILNENDSVSVRELIEERDAGSPAADPAHSDIGDGAAGTTVVDLENQHPNGPQATPSAFGDNDGLSAAVAININADLLLLLTNVPGLFDKNPQVHADARRIDSLVGIPPEVLSYASSAASAGGSGGMSSKVRAAQVVSDAGGHAVIASGDEPRIISRILAGEAVGTLISPPVQRKSRHRHIASTARCGALVVNKGALEAMSTRKASLLPIGLVAVEGDFKHGEVVEIRDEHGRVHGRGLVNYAAADCRKLIGRHSSDIDKILGWRGYNALITRINVVLGQV